MIKKYILSILFAFYLFPILISASTSPLAKIGSKYYDNLEDAIKNASSTDTIMLISNVELRDTLNINKVVNINLNGNDITAPTQVFLVEGGSLNITGKGTVKELEPNYGAIMIKGSLDINDTSYSTVNVSKDVTLEGWSGIFINQNLSKAYGVVVNLDGKINAIDDTNGSSGAGVYVNGQIKDKVNSPVINIKDNAKITSTGTGLYIAGYSTFNIEDAYIEGIESGISIKSGILNINGATVISKGKDKTPTVGNNNGINPSGATIQIESNSGYAGGIELNISRGNFTSRNSHVIYEYIGKGSNSLIYSMSFSGGNYKSEANKDVISLTNSFKDIHSGFISGGKYSSDVSEYLKTGYTASKSDGMYSVVKSTMREVNYNNANSKGSNNFIKITIILLAGIAIVSLLYFNKTKIYNLIEKIKSKI